MLYLMPEYSGAAKQNQDKDKEDSRSINYAPAVFFV